MIKRKLNEEYNKKLNNIHEEFFKTYDSSNIDIKDLYNCIFEDVKDANTISVDYRYSNAEGYSGIELFDEVLFNNGEIHRFFTDYWDTDKIIIEEVKFTPQMLEHIERGIYE